MTTNTYKYELGDTVYYLDNGKIYTAKIEKIFFYNQLIGDRKELETGITISYMTHARRYTEVKENTLFKTKEEAAKAMLKQAGLECDIQIKEIE